MTHRPELWHREGSVNHTLIARMQPGVLVTDLQPHLTKYGAAIGRLVGPAVGRLHLPEAKSEALAIDLINAGLVEYAEPDLEVPACLTPNDPSFSSQFPAAINISAAWNITLGSASNTVAVIDSGCDVAHEDMQVNILTGWNVLNSSTDITDNTGHGTATAGVIGATPNNSKGIAGLGWCTRVVPVKATDSNAMLTSNMATALDWIRLNTNARFVSISYAPNSGWGFSDSTLNAAINNCTSAGILCFFASGDLNNLVTAPTGNSNAMQIGGTNAFHRLSASNYGPGLNFYALGAMLLPLAFSQAGNETSYTATAGTSVSTPVCAAIAALCLAANSALSLSQIVTILSSPANGFPVSNLADGGPGWGLDAFRCVSHAVALRDLTFMGSNSN